MFSILTEPPEEKSALRVQQAPLNGHTARKGEDENEEEGPGREGSGKRGEGEQGGGKGGEDMPGSFLG